MDTSQGAAAEEPTPVIDQARPVQTSSTEVELDEIPQESAATTPSPATTAAEPSQAPAEDEAEPGPEADATTPEADTTSEGEDDGTTPESEVDQTLPEGEDDATTSEADDARDRNTTARSEAPEPDGTGDGESDGTDEAEPTTSGEPESAEPSEPEQTPSPAAEAPQSDDPLAAPDARGLDLPVNTEDSTVHVATHATEQDLSVAGISWPESTEDVQVFLRTSTDGRTTDWEAVDLAHVEPGATSVGTEPVVLTGATTMQVATVSATGIAPSLTVVDPRTAAADSMATASSSSSGPVIYSRRDWGADESLRGSPPVYAKVQGVVVHHTAGSNSYTREQVPGIIRGIYRYHTQTLGWSDIGYNVLVDKYGRAWEGRYGGLTRAVQGAHAYGTNHITFGISLMGDYEKVQPPAVAMDTMARVSGWKMSLHKVNTYATLTTSRGVKFPAISGHRDSSATSCPGRYIYGKMGSFRTQTRAYQSSYSGGGPENFNRDLTGDGKADLVVRNGTAVSVAQPLRASGERSALSPGSVIRKPWSGGARTISAGDVNRDGRADMIRVQTNGQMWLYRGNAAGRYAAPTLMDHGWQYFDLITGGADWNGDGIPDVIARNRTDGKLYLYRGRTNGTFQPRVRLHAGTWRGLSQATMVPRFVNGRTALVARTTSGGTVVLPASGNGTAAMITMSANLGSVRQISGVNDLNGDGRGDLLIRRSDGSLRIGWGSGSGQLYATTAIAGSWSWASSILPTASTGADIATHVVDSRDGSLRRHRLTFTKATVPQTRVLTVPSNTKAVINAGRWDGDAHPDLLVITGEGYLRLHRGLGGGRFDQTGRQIGAGWNQFTQVAGVHNFTGDGRPGLLALDGSGGRVLYYGGNGTGGFNGVNTIATTVKGHLAITAGGRMTGGRTPDFVTRDSSGRLYVHAGNGRSTIRYSRVVGTGWTGNYQLAGGAAMVGTDQTKPDVLVVAPNGSVRRYLTTSGPKVTQWVPSPAGFSLRGVKVS
ncbi:FG-GAP-like repeat-containing protein [Enemella sp. A6]|uniref:FG-GAP-like repeat-containing protein n=1 Tax=Enemella sp. A6 TaxID=3440152 RepID=UPI003EBA9F20